MGQKEALQGAFKWGKQKHYGQKVNRIFFVCVLNVKNQKAMEFKLEAFFYCLNIAIRVF